jgi:hypothetical protein
MGDNQMRKRFRSKNETGIFSGETLSGRCHGRNKRWWEAKLLCTSCQSYGAGLQVTPLIQRLRIAA